MCPESFFTDHGSLALVDPWSCSSQLAGKNEAKPDLGSCPEHRSPQQCPLSLCGMEELSSSSAKTHLINLYCNWVKGGDFSCCVLTLLDLLFGWIILLQLPCKIWYLKYFVTAFGSLGWRQWGGGVGAAHPGTSSPRWGSAPGNGAWEWCAGITPPKSTEGEVCFSAYTYMFALKGIFHRGDWCMALCFVGAPIEHPWNILMLGVQQCGFSCCFADLWAGPVGFLSVPAPCGW